MTTTSEPQIVAGPVVVPECTPWCEQGRKAHMTEHPDDRRCIRTLGKAPLTLHAPVKMAYSASGEEWHYDELEVMVRRVPGQPVEALVFHLGTDRALCLTLVELEALRALLTSDAEQVGARAGVASVASAMPLSTSQMPSSPVESTSVP